MTVNTLQIAMFRIESRNIWNLEEFKLPCWWNRVSKDASKPPVGERLEGSAPGLAVGGAAGGGGVEAAVHAKAAQLVAAIPGDGDNEDR